MVSTSSGVTASPPVRPIALACLPFILLVPDWRFGRLVLLCWPSFASLGFDGLVSIFGRLAWPGGVRISRPPNFDGVGSRFGELVVGRGFWLDRAEMGPVHRSWSSCGRIPVFFTRVCVTWSLVSPFDRRFLIGCGFLWFSSDLVPLQLKLESRGKKPCSTIRR
jgi:hypothetical protein